MIHDNQEDWGRRNSNGLNFRGLVTLKKSLNYEERSSYNLVVEAQDAGDNILSSTASIFVQVSGGDHIWIKVLENDDDAPPGGRRPGSEARLLECSLL